MWFLHDNLGIFTLHSSMLRDGKLNEKNGKRKQVGMMPGVFILGDLLTLILIN